NPFVLVETLRTLVEDGTLKQDESGRLIARDVLALPVPRRVHELIQARVAMLTGDQRRVINTAAVIGRPSSLRLLRRVSGQTELGLLDIVDQLVARGVLSQSEATLPEQAAALTHEYFRRVIYDDLGPGQQQVLHRRVAEALLALHPRQPH